MWGQGGTCHPQGAWHGEGQLGRPCTSPNLSDPGFRLPTRGYHQGPCIPALVVDLGSHPDALLAPPLPAPAGGPGPVCRQVLPQCPASSPPRTPSLLRLLRACRKADRFPPGAYGWGSSWREGGPDSLPDAQHWNLWGSRRQGHERGAVDLGSWGGALGQGWDPS